MARVAYGAGELLLRGAAVGIETIATTLDEGNEAARQIADDHRQILDAFVALPSDQQIAYLAVHEEDARARRAETWHRLSPIRAWQNLFHMDAPDMPETLRPIAPPEVSAI